MNFEELALKRQSVRKYSNKPIEKEKIEKCIEAARIAPSASNAQPWKFIVVDNPELKEKVAIETYSSLVSFNKFTHECPVIVAIVMEKPTLKAYIGAKIKDRNYSLIDIGISATHFCLQATELGLGTCMMGWFNEKSIKKLLGIPRGSRIGLLIAVGYAPDDYKLRTKIRKEKDIMSSFNKY